MHFFAPALPRKRDAYRRAHGRAMEEGFLFMYISERRKKAAVLGLFRAAIYLLLPAAFFTVLSATNPQLLRLNRTSVITVSSYCLLLYLFTRIYGAFQPGLIHARSNSASLSLSCAFTDLIVYIQLQIMNVNEDNNAFLTLLGVDALLLFAAFALQFALISLFCTLGDKIYFQANPPMRTCVIAGNEEDREIICNKLAGYARHFYVEDCILYTSEDVRGHVKRAQAVLLYHLPPAAHQELIAYAYKHKKVLYFDLNIGNIVSSHSKPYMLDDVLMHSHTINGLTLPQRFVKRAMDITISFIALVLISPLMLGCAVAVKLCDGGSVFFRQKRITRDAQLFYVLKFRTMKEHSEDERQHSARVGDSRVTKVGAFLRRWRLDELPQLINILAGDMSLVGPRPEMLENVEMYTHDLPEFAYRDRVKAGLTGYAQINGKYNTSPRDKLMMDITYIENYSIWLDIKLLLKTVLVFFTPDSTEGFAKKEEET